MRILALVLSICLISCNPKKDKLSENAREVAGEIYGSTYAIKYYSDKDLNQDIQKILYEFDKVANTYNINSLISEFNQGKVNSIQNESLYELVEICFSLNEKTNGYFDPTVKPLMNLWGFSSTKIKHLPTKQEVDSVMQFVGMKNIILSNNQIKKDNPKTQLSFNSVTGYVNDRVAEFFNHKGVENYLINIGSEITAHGQKPTKEVWAVGVDKPIENSMEQKVEVAFPLKDLSLATSGNYRKFYIDDDTGEKIVHTMNPKTGYPAKSNLLSASVIAKTCVEADATATALMAMGLDQAIEYVQTENKHPVYLIWSENDSILTQGFNEFPE